MIKIKAYYQFIFNLDLSKYKVDDDEGTEIIVFDNKEEYNKFLVTNQLEERTLADGTKVVVIPQKDAVYGKVL